MPVTTIITTPQEYFPIETPTSLISKAVNVAMIIQAQIYVRSLFEKMFNLPFQAVKQARPEGMVIGTGWTVLNDCGRPFQYVYNHFGCDINFNAGFPPGLPTLSDTASYPPGSIVYFIADMGKAVPSYQGHNYKGAGRLAKGSAMVAARTPVYDFTPVARPVGYVVQPPPLSPPLNPNFMRAAAPLVAMAQARPAEWEEPPIARPRWRTIAVTYFPPGYMAPPAAVQPVGPRPPRANEKESKRKRIRRVSGRIVAALDDVSEGAEVIDAFYDALPKEVRKKYDCDRFIKGRNPLIDNAGQYGIDRADCKMKALWNHWNEVDFDKAVYNVAANVVTDKIIGGVASRLPKQTPGVIFEPFAGVIGGAL